jgi:hypothetical protein
MKLKKGMKVRIAKGRIAEKRLQEVFLQKTFVGATGFIKSTGGPTFSRLPKGDKVHLVEFTTVPSGVNAGKGDDAFIPESILKPL